METVNFFIKNIIDVELSISILAELLVVAFIKFFICFRIDEFYFFIGKFSSFKLFINQFTNSYNIFQ